MLSLPSRRGHSVSTKGFSPIPRSAARRCGAGIDAVGIANNVQLRRGGDRRVDRAAGRDRHPACRRRRRPRGRPRAGRCRARRVRFGFLQRSSVYWPTNHEARDEAAGIAVIRGHTAYQVPMHKTRPGMPPLNRPGVPPSHHLGGQGLSRAFADDIAALRQQVDMVVASCHWGLGKEVLQYMTEIAHAAIDAGADIVIGHGPHYSLPVEVYRGKPIFYGLGSFSFHTGHGGRAHGDWIGMMARVDRSGGVERRVPVRAPQRGERDRALRPRRGGADVRPPRRAKRRARRNLTPGGDWVRVVAIDERAALQTTPSSLSPSTSRSLMPSQLPNTCLCARPTAAPARSSAACRRSAPGRSACAIRRSGAAGSG